MNTIEIIRDESRGRGFLDTIIEVTNTNKMALGFLPRAVYEEAIVLGRLWVAVDDKGTYRAHLLFGGAHPVMKIKQLFVSQEARKLGLARRLIDELVCFAEDEGYGSVQARVATDLDANAAWESLGFHIFKTVLGGETTGRQLNVRLRRLMPRGPQTHMFRLMDTAPARARLVARGLPIKRSQWYALDLNVWLDFARRRFPFFNSARLLIEAASRGQFRLRFTSEAKHEAERTAQERAQDPLLDVARLWEALPLEESPELEARVAELRALVFPQRSSCSSRAAADHSDLRHLAMSILCGATGFVTREKAMLRQRRSIRERFQLDVLEPDDLVDEDEWSKVQSNSLAGGLQVKTIKGRWDLAARFIKRSLAFPGSRLRALDVDDDGRLCCIGEQLVGIVYWSSSPRGDTEAYLLIDLGEGTDDSHQRVFDVLLGVLIASPSTAGLHRVVLTASPETGGRFGDELLRSGFFATVHRDVFVRFIAGDPLALADWADAKSVVDRELDVVSEWLGDRPEGAVLRLRRGFIADEFDRFDFETRFGLSALTLCQRRMVYIPIQEKFVNELLPGTPRPTLLQEHDAAFRTERVYFRSCASAGTVQAGDLVLFYVSQPISALIGAARCTVSEVLPTNEAIERFRRLAVLDPRIIGERVHCVAFDNYQPFKSPVTRQWLDKHGVLPAQEILSLTEVPAGLEPLKLLSQGLRPLG